MYKNQLQELAQRSCFNLPSYTCIREGPDHAPRFKATVNFNGETFECPSYCSTLRQAEHSAAEVALNALAGRGPSNSLAARILDETGVYKNLLQEVSQRVGACLPTYTTFRSGLGHLPVFTGTVELAGVIFTGDPAKNKKQAEKNAAMAAWFSLKSLLQQSETALEKPSKDEQEHVTVARALQRYLIKARLARVPFPIKFPNLNPRPANAQPSPPTTSKLLPMMCSKTPNHNRHITSQSNTNTFQKYVQTTQTHPVTTGPSESRLSAVDSVRPRPQKFPAAGAPPYIPFRHCNPLNSMAPPVTIRNAVPVFSAPPRPPPQQSLLVRPPSMSIAPSVRVRQAVPAYTPPIRIEEPPVVRPPTNKLEDTRLSRPIIARTEEPPPGFRAVSGKLEEPPVSKLPVILADDPLSCKPFPSPKEMNSIMPKHQLNIPPLPEIFAPVKSQFSEANSSSSSPPTNSKEESGEATTGNAAPEQVKLQESCEAEVEALKNLKV